MNTRIAHVAFNTFREAVRDRVLYNLIAFALLLSGAADPEFCQALFKREERAHQAFHPLSRVQPT